MKTRVIFDESGASIVLEPESQQEKALMGVLLTGKVTAQADATWEGYHTNEHMSKLVLRVEPYVVPEPIQ